MENIDKADSLENRVPVSAEAADGPHRVRRRHLASPLGWSIQSRLLCAAGAAALLWLAVAWAVGWLP